MDRDIPSIEQHLHFRRMLLILTGALAVIISSTAAWLMNEPSWFTILLVYTFVLSLAAALPAAVIFTLGSILYSLLFNLLLLERRLGTEVALVSVHWLLVGIVPALMMNSYRNRKLREEYYRAILHSSPSAIVTLDTGHKVREWNEGAAQLFGFSAAEAAGRNIDDLIAGENPERRANARLLTEKVNRGERIEPVEDIRYHRDHTPIHVIIAGAPITTRSGELRGAVAIYTDIGARKRAEARVQQMLTEKENLLREVHHRIKNHMNTITSLLGLHVRQHTNPEVAAEIEEIQGKILIMQNIYQSLYLGDNLQTVNLDELILSIIDDLRDSAVLDTSIEFTADLKPVSIGAQQSLPLGIIVNELITNAIKYAFPDKGRGRVSVSLAEPEDGRLRLTVADDGRGMQNREAHGFGLTLVAGYAEQYGGEMRIDSSEEGTRVTVIIRRESVEDAPDGRG